MSRKAMDSRVPTLIRNAIQEKNRGLFVVVGDRCKDAVVNLHYIVSTFNPRHNKNVLWAYKGKLLGFTSHKQKRENKIKKDVKRGKREANTEDPFELFVALQNIRYVHYKETEKILGNTYGMCILQDFEALTPNILARTMETVEGGGLVVLLLHGMKSLKQLYSLSMDVHSRYKTQAHGDVVPRFNERFVLSLGSCDHCLIVDDEFNVLPISGGRSVAPLPVAEEEKHKPPRWEEAFNKINGHDELSSRLVKLARTKDQAEAVVSFAEVIRLKTLRCTVALTAARGRGKSAALGMAVAAAVCFGYGNIFITSPSPENLKTFFEFVLRSFDALDYHDHADYAIMQSTNPAFHKAIVRVNIFKHQHRQTIQYIRPQDAHMLGQAELVVIDEAAAIPLSLVRKLMGPHLVFMASTISGYEGTGRSLSLKLMQQMRQQSKAGADSDVTDVDGSSGKKSDGTSLSSVGGRTLKEITLSEPIRYGAGDAVEKWLNMLLCLDATLPTKWTNAQGYPAPIKCQLLKVNRDTLFSFHPVSEKFLQKLVALFVSSHYKNAPDDLQLMSDAPAHEIFVLADVTEDNRLPEPLCVVQVCLEGKLNRNNVLQSLSRGQRPAGDLIPWLVSQQFQDNEFATLSGARVVRIATSPNHFSMGYGKRALELLVDYYEGNFVNLSEDVQSTPQPIMKREPDGYDDDNLKVRNIQDLPPLFCKLSESQPAALDYVGVSYGLTQSLFRFWNRASFVPLYVRQTANDLTGEHTCVMLRTLQRDGAEEDWLAPFATDFHRRLLALLSYKFREFPSVLGLSLQDAASKARPGGKIMDQTELGQFLTLFDLKRLEAYINGILDYHVMLDLAPILAHLYFAGRLDMDAVRLSSLQRAVLLAIGLQHKDVDTVAAELKVQTGQLLATFLKVVRNLTTYFGKLVANGMAKDMPNPTETIGVSRENAAGVHDDEVVDQTFVPLKTTIDEDIADEADEFRKRQRELIDSLPLDQYEIRDSDESGKAWEEADRLVAAAVKKGAQAPSAVSVKSGLAKHAMADERGIHKRRHEHEDSEGDKRHRARTRKGKYGL